MMLLTKANQAKLKSNFEDGKDKDGCPGNVDHKPVVKFFTPWGSATWLITEIVDEDTLFGLCDLGLQCTELGYVSLSELKSVTGPFGLKVERDLNFEADKTLSEYAKEARSLGYIKA